MGQIEKGKSPTLSDIYYKAARLQMSSFVEGDQDMEAELESIIEDMRTDPGGNANALIDALLEYFPTAGGMGQLVDLPPEIEALYLNIAGDANQFSKARDGRGVGFETALLTIIQNALQE